MRKLSMDELNRPTIEQFKNRKKLPVVLLLDSIRSLHNVGSIFRTADGFAIERIILCGITGQPPHREIEKTALGATQSIDWSYEKNIINAISHLRKENYQIIAIEQADNSLYLDEYQPKANKKYALILGNEVNGVSDEAMEMIDNCIEIPQFGTKHSLNVVVSAGIILWDFYAKITKG
ncbi:RNA methyltransferase [Albibacterium profundi]|uniref:RNA methyltransferase n=1 Tax=Albibacterium profundi TaxID=3134906 RepID=A0ABV5CAK5_9SPHI